MRRLIPGVSDVGLTFTRLTVLRVMKHEGRPHCIAACSCGSKPKRYRLLFVTNGHSKSCGCIRRENAHKPELHNLVRHGHSARGRMSPTYNSWRSMRTRCSAKSGSNFKCYAAKGIEICSRWDPTKGGTFQNFLSDCGERKLGQTLGRFEDANHYSCGSCMECKSNGWPRNAVWMTKKEQMIERRKKFDKQQLAKAA
jgi:hypothetical protein